MWGSKPKSLIDIYRIVAITNQQPPSSSSTQPCSYKGSTISAVITRAYSHHRQSVGMCHVCLEMAAAQRPAHIRHRGCVGVRMVVCARPASTLRKRAHSCMLTRRLPPLDCERASPQVASSAAQHRASDPRQRRAAMAQSMRITAWRTFAAALRPATP